MCAVSFLERCLALLNHGDQEGAIRILRAAFGPIDKY
jgi:hypothetical protein